MSKMRVYEIAKELNIESRLLIIKLQEMGHDVKSHASSVEGNLAENIILSLREEHQANVVEKRVSTGVIRRRSQRPVVPEKQEEPPAEEVLVQEEVIVEEAPVQAKPVAAPVRNKNVAVVLSRPEPAPKKPVETAPEPEPVAPAEEEPIPAEKAEEAPAVAVEAQETPAKAKPKAAPEKAIEEKTAATAAKKKPSKPSNFYQAKVIRKATPEMAALGKAPAPPKAPAEPRPSGIRVLKVVPGKEGRGHEFIDLSKKDKNKKKTTASKQSKADLREQLFDAFTPAYHPGYGRRRRMSRKSGKKTAVTIPKALKRVIKIETEEIAASDLAQRMGVKLIEVNGKLRDMGEEIDRIRDDHMLDLSMASMLAQEFEYEVQDIGFKEESILDVAEATPEELSSRAPVVTVMGHVDHGKTSILDAIRKTNVTDGEQGGITQHIGAYEIQTAQGSITFIDTPGHEAFTAMRARGASITDIVILVVAADDGIMPQTVEAIHHAKDAGVPIIVAINKIDLPGMQTDRIRQAMTEHGLVSESWGGETIIVEVSAKTKVGIDDLLENVLLQAELLELKANPDRVGTGAVIDARLDRGRGPVATLLIKDGTLHKGDVAVMGTAYGRIRQMFSFDGTQIDSMPPGKPVQVQGLSEVPQAGETFHIVKTEKEAKKLVEHRRLELRAALSGQTARLNLEDFYERLQGVEKLELKVLIKADVQGTAEAVKQSVEKLSVPKVSVKVIHHGVGAINETDVNLAMASDAILVGFNVRPDPNAKKMALANDSEIRVYRVIYDLTQDIRKAQTGLLPATTKEQTLGRAEVRELFTVPKIGTIAGVSVLDGKMKRGSLVRLLRDSVEIHQGKMNSLRRFKEDVREVAGGYECGIGIENYNDIKPGDIIEAYVLEQQQPTL